MAGSDYCEQQDRYSRVSQQRSFAVIETSSDEQRQSTFTENFINSYGADISSSRNAQLAVLKFYSSKIAAGEDFQDPLLSACWEYFKDFSAKVACFHDLQPYVASLERSKQEDLIEFCGGTAHEIRPKLESSEVSSSSRFCQHLLNQGNSRKRCCGSRQKSTC